MSPLKFIPVLVVAAILAGGCQDAANRTWQNARLPTHDWQRAFEVSREVLKEHFEIGESSVTKGTIVTRPQAFDRAKGLSLADLRGAGGRWRRTVTIELSRGGLDIDARAAVILEREGTNAAIALAQSGGYEEHTTDVPRSRVYGSERGSGTPPVWTEVGNDAGLAREILAKISERLQKAEQQEALPNMQSPKDAAEETRKLGAELNK
ncbi:MAG: hypothetical protein NT049_19475 [Planctomycetota bacterium]|nr:hypothetical protein [Planctomycetota bacterium]